MISKSVHHFGTTAGIIRVGDEKRQKRKGELDGKRKEKKNGKKTRKGEKIEVENGKRCSKN